MSEHDESDDDQERDTVSEDLQKAIADYFASKQDGSMLTEYILYAQVMPGDGTEMETWIVPSPNMSLVTKMGVAAYLRENFRGMLQHHRSGDD